MVGRIEPDAWGHDAGSVTREAPAKGITSLSLTDDGRDLLDVPVRQSRA
jgi:hypothetical protein